MIAELELVLGGDRALLHFNVAVHELFDLAAVQAHDVIVVRALVQFEHGSRAFEMVACHQSSRFELGQHAIHRGQTDVVVGMQQVPIDVFRAHVTRLCAAQDFQDLEARHGDLEPRFAQVFGFQAVPPAKTSGRRGDWLLCAPDRLAQAL